VVIPSGPTTTPPTRWRRGTPSARTRRRRLPTAAPVRPGTGRPTVRNGPARGTPWTGRGRSPVEFSSPDARNDRSADRPPARPRGTSARLARRACVRAGPSLAPQRLCEPDGSVRRDMSGRATGGRTGRRRPASAGTTGTVASAAGRSRRGTDRSSADRGGGRTAARRSPPGERGRGVEGRARGRTPRRRSVEARRDRGVIRPGGAARRSRSTRRLGGRVEACRRRPAGRHTRAGRTLPDALPGRDRGTERGRGRGVDRRRAAERSATGERAGRTRLPRADRSHGARGWRR
jgi:hypothetical protein